MKLYTEEQVCKIIQKTIMDKPITYDEVLECYTPIELPSDEEIEEKSHYKVSNNTKTPNWYFISGAKWMKEQILNQNKKL